MPKLIFQKISGDQQGARKTGRQNWSGPIFYRFNLIEQQCEGRGSHQISAVDPTVDAFSGECA